MRPVVITQLRAEKRGTAVSRGFGVVSLLLLISVELCDSSYKFGSIHEATRAGIWFA